MDADTLQLDMLAGATLVHTAQAVTMSAERYQVCFEALCELEQLMRLTRQLNSEHCDDNDFVIRGLLKRAAELVSVLVGAVDDKNATIAELSERLH